MTRPRMSEETRREIMEDGWPCACVRRDRQGNLKSLKLHHPSEEKCAKCGTTRAMVDDAIRQGRERV